MRYALGIAGSVTLAYAWLGPLPEMATHAFYAHMTLHMLVVAIAAPLLALAMAGLAVDPVRRVPALFAPIPASVGELIIVWAWHAPWLHHVARNTTSGFVVEQSMFLLAGLWVWLSAFGGSLPRSGNRIGTGIIGLLLTSTHMTLLGALLALAPRPLFNHHHTHGSMTPLEDQHLGGAVMLVVGGIAYLAGGLWLTRELVNRSSTSPRSNASLSTEANATGKGTVNGLN